MKPTQAYLALAKAIAENGSPACEQSDPEAFYPPRGEHATIQTRLAKELCKACPVKTECLNYALIAREPFGIWGGLTTEDRDRLLRSQRRSGSLSSNSMSSKLSKSLV
jgi:WhiB family redox-sensing transcriptional regulator